MTPAWKLLCDSAAGTSHERGCDPCQDYAHGVVVAASDSPMLVVGCADGAGSASHASLGARLACLGFIRVAAEALRDGLPVREIDAQRVLKLPALRKLTLIRVPVTAKGIGILK